MKITIAGYGMVGGATHKMIQNGPNAHEVAIYDPLKGQEGSIAQADVVFICVPVPTKKDSDQDLSILESILRMCNFNQHIFIRSTIIPGTTEWLNMRFFMGKHKQLYHMPEFLTERQVEQDVLTLPVVCTEPAFEVLMDIFPHKEFNIVKNNKQAEYLKYVHNCFAAVKVGFFNTVYNTIVGDGMTPDDYREIVDGAIAAGTKFIEKTHTMVPGPDGQFGFGGKCFPKDLKAFANHVEFITGKTFLSEVVDENFHNRFGGLF